MNLQSNYKRIFEAVLLLCGILFLFLVSPSKTEVVVKNEIVEEIKPDPFQNLDLEAKAVHIIDVNRHLEIFSKNPDEALPLASVTKIMTALAARRVLPDHAGVTIEPDDLAEEGDSGLFLYETWDLNDLIDFTLAVSSNDGASAIANAAGSVYNTDWTRGNREAFIEKMNETAQEIGLSQTYFFNESGLDIEETIPGGVGSARDMTALFEYTLLNYPELFNATKLETFEISSRSNLSHTAVNTNKIIGKIPGLIGSKTGFTDLSGGNLVVVFDAGFMRPVIIAVLGSSVEGRFKDVETLVATTIQHINQGN